MDYKVVLIEAVGWLSTAIFLVSIVMPRREHLHWMGVFASITTGMYAYSYGATAIWVKWLVALFFHIYMILKERRSQ